MFTVIHVNDSKKVIEKQKNFKIVMYERKKSTLAQIVREKINTETFKQIFDEYVPIENLYKSSNQ